MIMSSLPGRQYGARQNGRNFRYQLPYAWFGLRQFLRPETLREANNRTSNAIAKQSIFSGCSRPQPEKARV